MARIGGADSSSTSQKAFTVKVRVLDVAEAASWYEGRLNGLGDQFLDAYSHCLKEIEEHPEQFSRMETIPDSSTIRPVLLSRFPYAVVYEMFPDEVIVLAVAHVSRRPNYWIGRR